MAQYAWTCCDETHLINAKNEDEAFRIAIANRLTSGQTLEEAVRWFRRDDSLSKIGGEVTDAPFAGDIPEDDEDDEDGE